MMRQCCSSQGENMVGPCSCGVFHGQRGSFSMLFNPNSSSDHHHQSDQYHMYHQYASASVDCTLSLGTPSTRMSADQDSDDRRSRHQRPSYFCWDVLQPKVNSPTPAPQSHRSTARSSAANDPLLARRCANCDTTSTPLWRNGPRGPKSLCNACGIRFKKEERRATAAAATGGGTEHEPHMFNNSSWVHHQSQKTPCYSPAGTEFLLIDDVDSRDSILSWRLNVTDRPGLVVHDFTR